ncbi:Os04g0617500 [Oryza sativa Japonica Group]|uniref:Os04g0617500 protein n=1 Tax=Oryza sativa subsp. japonica TaxID=39947 RepID=A0A0P0WET9_ORYSJ|nr:Os04g0617500 [Oryza sativa Japonica Group]
MVSWRRSRVVAAAGEDEARERLVPGCGGAGGEKVCGRAEMVRGAVAGRERRAVCCACDVRRRRARGGGGARAGAAAGGGAAGEGGEGVRVRPEGRAACPLLRRRVPTSSHGGLLAPPPPELRAAGDDAARRTCLRARDVRACAVFMVCVYRGAFVPFVHV